MIKNRNSDTDISTVKIITADDLDEENQVGDLMRDDLYKIAKEIGIISAISSLVINMEKSELKKDLMKILDEYLVE